MPNRQAAETRPPRLRITGRSIAAVVATVGLTFAALRVLASAERVLAWVAIAASLAALLFPMVTLLARRMPRGLAVAVVMITGLAIAGGVTYGLVGDVVAQTQRLQEQAPRLAEEVEREGRFAEAAREARLSERAATWVEEVPARLRGGTPAEALRSAATRGLAFLAVSVLTLFFLLHGPTLAAAAARQIHDDDRRERAKTIAGAVYERAFGYARGTIAMSILAGAVAYALARFGDVPGPAPLAIWMALWDAVPLLGAVLGALPIVLFAFILDPTKGALLAVAFVAYQVGEYLVLQRRLESRTVRVGPFLTTAAGFAGLEMYGLAGALLAMLAMCMATVALDAGAEP